MWILLMLMVTAGGVSLPLMLGKAHTAEEAGTWIPYPCQHTAASSSSSTVSSTVSRTGWDVVHHPVMMMTMMTWQGWDCKAQGRV
jgi:hypothetical protein